MVVIRWAAGLAGLFLTQSAFAHGIAGNRYFPGTLTFDDPAVADELVIGWSSLWLNWALMGSNRRLRDGLPITLRPF
jgi:hypothetical protein